MVRANVWPWVRPFLILVIVIAVPPMIYWFGYVKNSVASARQEAYATLSAVTADFRLQLISYDRIAKSAEKHSGPQSLQEYLSSIINQVSFAQASIQPDKSQTQSHLALGSDSGGLRLRVKQKLCPCAPEQEGCPQCVLQAVIPLENLIQWNIVRTKFDGLLVMSKDTGALMAQDRRLPAQALGVRVPLTFRGASVDFAKLFSGEYSGAAAGKQEGSGRRDPADSLFEFRDEASLQLAGVDYVAFIQVVTAPTTEIGSGEASGGGKPTTRAAQATIDMIVCGLIAKERLRREAIQLSAQTLIMVASLVALGLFAIPFLKLRFIGEYERMRRRDVWLLSASILSATALMVILLLNFHARGELRSGFDAGLRQLTGSLVKNLKRESEEALHELRESAPELISAALREGVGTSNGNACAAAPVPARGGVLTQRPLYSYPDIESIVLMDRCGNQLYKWQARTIPTPYVNAKVESLREPLREPYFEPALTSTKKSHAGGYVFTVTLARTSGLLLGLHSLPVGAGRKNPGVDVDFSQRIGVVTISSEMRSVAAPVIAEPYQFVLVNRRGEVTFQKAQGSYQGERFFEAVRGGEVLRVSARVPVAEPQTSESDDKADRSTWPRDIADYEYHGKSYRMKAVDIPELELTLVSFYDTAEIGSLSALVFSTAVLFALGLVAAVLVGSALSIIVFREAAFDWAWPSRNRTAYFVVGTAICLWFMLLVPIARDSSSSDWFGWLILTMPLSGILAVGALGYIASGSVHSKLMDGALHGIDRTTKRLTPRSVSLMSWIFTAFAVVVLLAFIAWPTMIIFNDAFAMHSSAYMKEVSRNWKGAEKRWSDLNRESLVNVGKATLDPPNCQTTQDPRCIAPERTYAYEPNYAKLLAQRKSWSLYRDCASLRDPEEPCSVEAQLDVPFSSTVSIAHLAASLSRIGSTRAQIFEYFRESQAGTKPASILSQFHPSLWAAGGLAVLLLALGTLIRSIAKNVLGIEMTEAGPLDERAEVKPEEGSTWLLIRPSRDTLKQIHAALECDLRSEDPAHVLVELHQGQTVIVKHLESRLPDRNGRKQMLALLNGKHAGCIVLTSEVDPLHYLTQRLRESRHDLRALPAGEKDRRAAAEKERTQLEEEVAQWATAMRGVRRIREPVPEFGVPVESGSNAEVVKQECESAEPLLEIGRRLLKRKKLESYRREEVIGFVRDAAEPYYRSIWELSSREERLVLVQLAQEGLVNPKREDIVCRLARRGLVHVDPRFRLMNKSFAYFVRNAEPPERVTHWEQSGTSMPWSRLATPLYALAAMVIAVLLFAEQGFVTDILAVATGSVATLGSLRHIYASVRSAPRGGTPA